MQNLEHQIDLLVLTNLLQRKGLISEEDLQSVTCVFKLTKLLVDRSIIKECELDLVRSFFNEIVKEARKLLISSVDNKFDKESIIDNIQNIVKGNNNGNAEQTTKDK